ncbi:MAG TPA: NAD-dependent epimerase/dehydratase family protein [Chloroflexota bacterium]|nr:NAD-dependent epimerase/dehydratase family protein [Chloroflexota bacterium]
MKYFLTGATGFIGGVLARQLRTAGHDVHAVVRSRARAIELADLGVQLFEGDVTQKESLRAAMVGTDGVFHVAGWYRTGVQRADRARAYAEAEATNVAGTRNVLELMRELAVPKGVYTSTLAINSDSRGRLLDESYHFTGRHISIYDETKWRAHYEVALPAMRDGLPLVIVQPGLVYGPGDTSALRRNLVQYLRRRLPVVPQRTAYSWAHVEDTAHSHLLAMEKGRTGESYNVNGPAHTLEEAFALAERITGVPAPRLHIAPAVLRGAAVLTDRLERLGRLPLPETYTAEGLRVVAGVTYLGDNRKAQRDLGFNPRALEDGLRETLLLEMRLLGLRPTPSS